MGTGQSKASKQRAEIWARENSVADYLPYSTHLDENTIKTESGDYLQIIKVVGIAHESADEEDIAVRVKQLNALYRNIASPDLALYSHLIRRYQNAYPDGDYPDGFSSELNNKYRNHLSRDNMMITELYITVVYRPEGKVSKLFGVFDKVSVDDLRELTKLHLEHIHDITTTLIGSLVPYEPELLSTYQYKGLLFSRPMEFLGYLINGEWQRFPVTRSPIKEVISISRPFFGHETIEIRGPDSRVYAAILGIKEYPETTEPGMLNELLSSSFPLVISQSFVFKSRPVALELMRRQRDRMINAGDFAQSQIESLDDALDDLSSGRFVMGDHHLSLLVLGKSLDALKRHISTARSALADTGMVVAREDLALEAAFWAQLPANFKYRPRPAPITSYNFAGLASLHNYPSGRIDGNQWGPAVTLLKTSSGTPYYFNFHEPVERPKTGSGTSEQKALGNTTIIGPSGSGKTVIQGFLLSQLIKFGPTTVVFDKDRGLDILIRALGGTYLPLKKGEPTGFNPFSRLENTPGNILFLEDLVKKLCESTTKPFTVRELDEISEGVRATMSMPVEHRRLSSVLAYMDKTKEDGAGARLRRWCALTETGSPGPLSWVFDNETDDLDFSGKQLFGFDVTEFLDDPTVRTPVVMYLFHRMDELIGRGRFVCFMDEFWKMLQDDYFEDFANNKLKTIRKQDGFLVLGTQSPRDVLLSPISHSIIEQSATLIFLPNPKAQEEDYIDGFKLSRREYMIVKEEMPEGSRRFLVKQGSHSVVAELNLKGFNDELAVISGNSDSVALLQHLIDKYGDDPNDWLPEFQKARRP